MHNKNNENLISLKTRSLEDRKRIAAAGGRAAAKVKRKKRMISEIYAQSLSKIYSVEIGDVQKRMNGERLILYVIGEILERRDSASVALLKEIREATEGSKLDLLAVTQTSMLSASERLEAFKELQENDQNSVDNDINEKL